MVKSMSFKSTDFINVFTNVATLVGLGIGTLMIMNDTKKAERTIVISSIAMSALAIGVSFVQTEGIKESIRREAEETESKLNDSILRRVQ